MSPLPRTGRALAASIMLAATGAFGVCAQASALPAAGSTPAPSTTTTARPAAASTPSRPVVGGEALGRPGVIVDRPAGVPAPPAMPCGSWLVADLTTGEVLAAKAPHARFLPASTLKTLAALALIPRVRPEALVKATPEDANADGTRVGLMPGTAYRAGTLFQAMLMASANDAVYALASANGGRPHTVGQMNAIARHLGALDTLAVDPSGLDGPGQTSSAYDLALIGRAAMQLPDFRTYVATRHITFPGGKDARGRARPAYDIQNHDRLLYNYPGAIGIKNGYTIAAKQTFIGAATRHGHTYLVTQMAGTNGSWRVTAKMLDWAFAYGTRVKPVGTLVEPGALEQGLAHAQSGLQARTLLAGAPGAGALATPPLRPWVGGVGLLGAVTLVGALATRAIRRTRR
ncbi:MAG: D-alanyl-D-alanine carboxypeptidase family protein [Oryzihumus sp.]